MSNGLTASSSTQISECGSEHTVSVSADPAEPTASHDKSSAAEKIAKDTGCCLYSAITVIVVMLVSIGIVLIVTGPVLGMSIWPTASKSLDHPVKSNSIFFTNETHESSNNNNDTGIHDYQADYYDTWSDEVANGTAEDLSDLSPEALRLGPKGSYIAYLPIPINQDDEWDEEEDYNTQHIGESNKGDSRLLLPVVMVPDDQHDSPRRFDEHLPDDYINDSSQSQIRSSGIDYKMFGSLAPVQQRPPSGGGGRRYGAKDDYGRTTVLGPPRTNAKRKQGGRRRPPPPPQQNQRGPAGPSRYIRPPPKRGHRIQTRYPQQWTADSGINSQRYINDYRRDHAVTKRPPLYSYPKEAMNIQDIINYMTSLGNSDNPSSNTHKPTTSRESWVAPPPSYSGNSRIGSNFAFNSRDSRPHSPSDVRSKTSPYSFMLDVYPVRDSGASASSHHHPSPSIQTSAQHPTSQFSSRPGEIQYVDDYQQQQYAVTRRPYVNYVDQSSLRDQHDQLPVPIAFRPTPSPPVFSNNRPAGVAHPPRDEDLSTKPKLVVHLNVYNQKNSNNNNPSSGRSQHFQTRHDDEYDPYEDYFSPTDIYRAVLRNNAAKRDQYLQAGSDSDFHHMMSQDDGLPGGQSRISSVTHQITSDLDQPDSHLIENHNLAIGSGASYGTNYRSISTPSEDYYRPSNQIRNHHQTADDVVEPLPIPLPLNGTAVEASTHP